MDTYLSPSITLVEYPRVRFRVLKEIEIGPIPLGWDTWSLIRILRARLVQLPQRNGVIALSDEPHSWLN